MTDKPDTTGMAAAADSTVASLADTMHRLRAAGASDETLRKCADAIAEIATFASELREESSHD